MTTQKKFSLKTTTAIVCLAIILTSGLWYALGATPTQTQWFSGGIYSGAPSYTIFREGSNYFAKDAWGQIDYSGTNASGIINNAISNAPEGSTVYLTCAEYIISNSIIIDKSISLIGEGFYEGSPISWGGYVNPDNPPIRLHGGIFRVTSTNTPAIRILGEVYSVTIKNIGIQFDVADTLEGLKIEPSATGWGRKGLCYGEFENIAVLGNDGECYAFEFKNFQHLKCSRLRSWGGGFMFIQVANTGDVNYGNSVFEELYTFTNETLGATKPVVWISTANASAIQNLMVFNRLQINSHAGNTGYAGLHLEGAKYTTFVGLDIETDLHYPLLIEDESDYVTFVGGLIWSSNSTSKIVVDATSDCVSFSGMTLSINSFDVSGTKFWVETTEFKSSNSGYSSSVTSGTWISHGLFTTPTSIVATCTSDVNLYISDKNATKFQVGCTGTINVYWQAEVRT